MAGLAVGIGICVAWYHGYGWWLDGKREFDRYGRGR